MTISLPTKGALTGAAVALVWLQWGFWAMLFVVVAAAIGAFVAATALGHWNAVEALRNLQDRP